MKKLLTIRFALIILILVSVQAPTIAKDAKTIYKESVKSIVTIVLDNNKLGTGFFISDNLVVTNYHVIDGACKGVVKFAKSDSTFEVLGIVANDAENDLVILKVDYKNSTYFFLENKPIEPGTKIFSMGSPKGLEATISEGMISATEREMEGHKLIQHNAPISHGSSGGPLLNEEGKIVGVNVGGYDDAQNLNFAIPVYTLIKLTYNMGFVEKLCKNGKTTTVKTLPKVNNTVMSQEEFAERAHELVLQLGDYISIIADKEEEDDIRKTAVTGAVDLFLSPNSIIEVSNKYRKEVLQIGAKTYFNRLFNLPYEKVEVSWHKAVYVSDIKKGADGNYYGLISVEQKFVGYGTGGEVKYSDITVKHIEIIIKLIDDYDKASYKIFLNSIRVVATS